MLASHAPSTVEAETEEACTEENNGSWFGDSIDVLNIENSIVKIEVSSGKVLKCQSPVIVPSSNLS